MIQSDAAAVREGLFALFDTPLLRLLPPEERGTAEIVLAEALNNIVEHAYAGGAGDIDLMLCIEHGNLVCRIKDCGRPMPGEVLPVGALRHFDGLDDMPEGGFGWHLIRSLAHDLRYRRTGNANLLSFRLGASQ